MSSVGVLMRKEAGEVLLSARGLTWLLALSAILSVFALLLVSNTELSLLDNAQVVYDMAGLVTALGALLALILGADSVAGERERGTLVPLLVTPLSRGSILAGKLGGLLIAWIVMYVLALPYVWAVGSTGQNMVDAMVVLAVLGTPVVLAFAFFGMGLGASLGSLRSSLLTGLVVLILSASPLLLGPGLRQSAVGRLFDSANPFSGALNAYDAVIIDSEPLVRQAGHWLTIVAWTVAALAFAVHSFRRVSR
jgi:ABC-type transport system involved in multi-copper enzyme maturation permease subunit